MATFSPSSVHSLYTSALAPAGGRGAGRHLSYRVVVIVVILSVVITLSGFLHVLARFLRRYRLLQLNIAPRPHSPQLDVSALHGQLQELFHSHDAGLDQAYLNTLPTFAYGAIRGFKDSADCAVCLNEFGNDDRLRLLPKCKHAFHLYCIDKWLLSHSTCPLCRRSLLPNLALAHPVTASTSCCRHGDPPAPTERAIEMAISPSARRIQEIEEPTEGEMTLQSAPSPLAPTICVVDERGEERVLKVELGRVAAMSQSNSRKLTTKGARSYSVGSYEYVVELAIAPTALSKLSHRSAFSDSVPELVSDELFWASRGLYAPSSRPCARALLTPIVSSNQSSPFLELSSCSPGRTGDRWIDIDIERGEVVDTDRPSPASISSSSPGVELVIDDSITSTLQWNNLAFIKRFSGLSRIELPELGTTES